MLHRLPLRHCLRAQVALSDTIHARIHAPTWAGVTSTARNDCMAQVRRPRKGAANLRANLRADARSICILTLHPCLSATHLRWDASYVETSTTERSSTLDACDFEADLCCLDRCYVSTWTAPDHDQVLHMSIQSELYTLSVLLAASACGQRRRTFSSEDAKCRSPKHAPR